MQNVTDYGIFHDGWLEGLWLDNKAVQIFVATAEHERYVIVATGVTVLKADDVREGNIIFDVTARPATELSTSDLDALLYNPDDAKGMEQATALLQRARAGGLTLLQITPSYGAICTVLAKSFELLTRAEWSARRL